MPSADAASSVATLELPGEITIYTASELHPQWLAWLRDARGNDDAAIDAACEIDGSEVGEIDAAGLQLLLSLARGLEAAHRRMSLVDPSRTLVAACEALGMKSLLSLPAFDGASN